MINDNYCIMIYDIYWIIKIDNYCIMINDNY